MKVEELQMAAVTAAMVKELREMTGAGKIGRASCRERV